jgi:hypothetical protein
MPYNVVLTLPSSFLVRLLHFTDVLDNGFTPRITPFLLPCSRQGRSRWRGRDCGLTLL